MILGSFPKSHVLFGAKGQNGLETSSCCTVWCEQDLPRGGWRQTQKSRTVWRELFLQIWRRNVWRGVISLQPVLINSRTLCLKCIFGLLTSARSHFSSNVQFFLRYTVRYAEEGRTNQQTWCCFPVWRGVLCSCAISRCIWKEGSLPWPKPLRRFAS